ncbi:UDP-D-apiose/UDP-D-xylose synthase [Quillaja saponaria]|uniref:UDP-D-apiose/UDP-D-xylose synthase n=1 Tax=Quillaja saponaria TaxID=32244 RepID=A0AAD7QHZ4_QUISA|nr:UDP-D-apiose/UDP-D-xylose synthase [Quillaja saponaria]
MERVNLDGKEIKPLTICLISGGGFVGSHLCEKLMADTSHKAIVVDISSEKINHLLDHSSPWRDRIEFHKIKIKNDSNSLLETLIKASDLTINLSAICTPYMSRPLARIKSYFLDAILNFPVVKYCTESNKRLIHFSTCGVYENTERSFLPEYQVIRKDVCTFSFGMEQEPNLLKEDASPSICDPIGKHRWSYACAKQMMERLIYAEDAEHGLDFTIVIPFNWIGPEMDFIPGVDRLTGGVPRVLACFSNNLLRGEPLKVDCEKSQRSFCYIKDAIEAILLMIENPERANGQIFDVGNPDNEVTVKQFAEMMIEVYAKVGGKSAPGSSTIDVSSEILYGEGYDDIDQRIPDMTIISKQLGWKPTTSLQDLLEITLSYQHQTYSQSIKK